MHDLVYVLVFLGGTWKDWGAMDMRTEEGMEGVDLGGGLRTL